MKIVFLDALSMGEGVCLDAFHQLGEFQTYLTTSPEERIAHIGDATVVLTNKVVIDKPVMDVCPSLELICITATGKNNVDLAYAQEKGIVVKNVAGYSTASVAQTTLMLVLSLIGQGAYYDTYVKEGLWIKAPVFTHLDRSFWEIKGKRWGIIGLGTIGREVAKIASAFGADVVYYSASGKTYESEYAAVSLDEMLSTCEIITIHAPLNEYTHYLIGEDAFSKMKERAVLVNVGRGGIVDEAALCRVIDTKELYVGLDVLEQEPMKAGHPLLDVTHKERLLLTPHVAWGSQESRTKLMELVHENIKTYLSQRRA